MPPDQGDPWDSLWDQIETFRNSLAKSRAQNVNTQSLRGTAKAVVQSYFRVLRPELARLGLGPQELGEVDTLMQQLLRLANGQNSKQSYVKTIGEIRRARPQLDIRREMLLGAAGNQRSSIVQGASPSGVEDRILSTLQQLLPSAASSYQQALLDLQAQGRVSYRGTAVELREALREVLDHFAPDEAVLKSPGFAFEKGASKPTMRQKARFILKSLNRADSILSSAQESVTVIEEATASLARSVYQRSSLSTHVATTEREVRQLKLYADATLAELLEIH
jgi:hypothetical protein